MAEDRTVILPSLISLQISCQVRRGVCVALSYTVCFHWQSIMFGIQGYHLLYVFLGLPRYDNLYLNMPLNTPTHRLTLPITEVLQAAIKLKPGLTLITEINCEFNRNKVQGGAVLCYKTGTEHTANITVCRATAEQARVQQDQPRKSQRAVCWHLNFTLSPLVLQSEEILFPEPLFPVPPCCCSSQGPDLCSLALLQYGRSVGSSGFLFLSGHKCCIHT